MDWLDNIKEALASVRYGARLFGAWACIVAAVVGLFFLPTTLLWKFIIAACIVLPVAVGSSYRFGRKIGESSENKRLTEQNLLTAASESKSSVIKIYETSQHPDFIAHASQLAKTAKEITLIATGLNLIWNEPFTNVLIERARSREARVAVCMGHHRNPHVLDRLIEEHMDEGEAAREGKTAQEHASFTRGADKVKALVERLQRIGNPEYFEVLLFAHYPTFATLIFDDQIFVYSYAYIISGTHSPILQIKDGTPEARFIRQNAQRMLRDAVPARDVVQARGDQTYQSNEWKTAAVFAIPESDTNLYQAGSEVLGYDVWQGSPVSSSSKNSNIRRHVGAAADFGFQLALTDPLLFGNQAMIERVRAELRWLAEQFSAVSLTALSIEESIHDPAVALLQASDESGALEALHYELVSRVYSIAVSSAFRARRPWEQHPQYDARAKFMIQRYGAPNILSAFAPHFTLCSAMPADPAARSQVLEDLKSVMGGAIAESCSLTRLVLAGRNSLDGRWSVLDSFKLSG